MRSWRRIYQVDQIVANKLGHGLYMMQDGKFLWVNQSFAEIFGYDQDEIQKKDYIDFIYSEDRDKLLQLVVKSRTDELEQYEVEVRGVKKDGNIIDISISDKRIVFNEKPTSIGSVIDISQRKKMELELKQSQERYRNLVENAPIGIIVHQKGIIEFANPMASHLLGVRNSNNILGQSMYNFVHYDFKTIVLKRIENIEKLGETVPAMHQKFLRLDGKEIDVEVSGRPIQFQGITATEIMFWDVTNKKKEEELIRYRAYYDTLTDLPNRHKFQLDLAEEFNKDQLFTMLYLDLEELRDINHHYGRQAGDIVLMKIGARLSGAIGHNSLVYRIDGDRFTIVLQGHVKEGDLREVTERIAAIASQPIYTNDTTVYIPIHIGVVYYPTDGVEMDMLLHHADMAMNYARKTKTLYKKYDS